MAVPVVMLLEAARSGTSAGLQQSERSSVGRAGEIREASRGENRVNGSPQGVEPQTYGRAFLVKLTLIFLWWLVHNFPGRWMSAGHQDDLCGLLRMQTAFIFGGSSTVGIV